MKLLIELAICHRSRSCEENRTQNRRDLEKANPILADFQYRVPTVGRARIDLSLFASNCILRSLQINLIIGIYIRK